MSIERKQPVIVLVGHIDHGKSSILESIKSLGVLEKESGGITQHISAYEVERGDEVLTFIDTPGHAAFTEMRARGAKIADLAILVIAADEGVMPQTEEAIKHLKDTKTPFVVAINKIDKTEASPKKIKDQLVEHEVVVEDRGGEVPCVEISAETKKGIEELLEMLSLLSEMHDIKVEFNGPASGVVIESNLSPKRGPLATLLVQSGTLKEGDIVGMGSSHGKGRRLEDFTGDMVKEVKPGQAVSILGLKEVPNVGDIFNVYSTIDEARRCACETECSDSGLNGNESAKKTLNIIIKTDMVGSLDPVKQMLKEIPQDKVCLNLLQDGIGDVSVNDIKMAETCDAIIVGFRVGIPEKTRKESERARVRIFTFDIIYELKESLIKIMESYLGPQKVRVNLAKMKVLVVFKTERKRQVLGVKVEKGEVKKGSKIEIFKQDASGKIEIEAGEGAGTGKVVGVQQNKKEIKSGKEGNEIGMLYEGAGENAQEGDILVAYEIREKMLELD